MQKPKPPVVKPSPGQLGHAAKSLMAGLAEFGSAERGEQERAYLRSDMAFLGVTVPESRRVVKGTLSMLPGLDGASLIALADLLWREPMFEGRRCAVELLMLRSALLGPDDLGAAERLLRDSYTWALVDGLAVHVAGAIFHRDPETSGPVLDRWSQDPDFWIRRSAVLALLPGVRAGAPDLVRFDRYADAMLEEKEFFIRKAIGWTLREISQRDPDFVVQWTTPRVGRMSGVTLREAVRRLPEDDRERLTAAYRER
ncbi:MAG TPA: DNA alkylation repair protein [Actinocrinis sp.]|nr:DNA alkylation repair protein [Actinocrinis sp.]